MELARVPAVGHVRQLEIVRSQRLDTADGAAMRRRDAQLQDAGG
jgi:hypothetical protein